MAIVQDAFYIPEDIAAGIATGLYKRFGGVVRYAAGPKRGQIVKHLLPIELVAVDKAQGVGEKAFEFLEEHIADSVVMVSGLAAVGALACTLHTIINREPKVVTEFKSALIVYLEAIRQAYSGWIAQIIQHECDHLEGIII